MSPALGRSIHVRQLLPRTLPHTTPGWRPDAATKSITSSVHIPFSPSSSTVCASDMRSKRGNRKPSCPLKSRTPVCRHHRPAGMATMAPTHGHSKSCCNTPPVVASGYTAKGTYEQLGGMNTYVTGSDDATKGIVSIYDIFGYFEQTLQGADILAKGVNDQAYKVFMPDWFKGNPVPIEWYPPDTDEKQKKLGDFFGDNDPHGVAAALPEYVQALQAANPFIKSWGILGYCWGGKVVELITSDTSSNPFTIAAAAHPAMIDATDADKISVPYIMLASGEDPSDKVQEFRSKLGVPHHVEIFDDQIHGWMAARGDLADQHVRAEYARGYETLLGFFDKHWK